jgi:DNA-binding SARP family transcriptional activator
MFGLLYDLALEQLSTVPGETRLVIVHPNFIPQHALLTHLLAGPAAAYVRFDGGTKLAPPALQAQLTQCLAEQVTSDEAAGLQTLVLDELDRASDEALQAFLPDVLAQFPSARVYALMRVSPQLILQDESLRQQISYVPVDESLMLWDYAEQASKKNNLLEVYALGNGRVILNGKEINAWDGVLPRSLFFYLVDKGMTTRDDIFKTFWSRLTVREATNVFHVTKRKISEVLGIDLTHYWSSFYRLSEDITLSYDVVLLTEGLRNSVLQPPAEQAETLRRAISLYKNNFLSDLDMDWVHNRRDSLWQDYGDALIQLAKLAEEADNKAEALGLYLAAIATNPQREDVVYHSMLLCRDLGYYEEALVIYNALAEELNRELNVEPAKHIQELAILLRQQ